jgi:hypothetical protein
MTSSGTGGSTSTSGSGGGGGSRAQSCQALDLPTGNLQVNPNQAGQLASIVAGAQAGDAIVLADAAVRGQSACGR